MDNKEEILDRLYDKDNKLAYEYLIKLENISNKSSKMYEYFDMYLTMLISDKSFIRVRGFRLICANAKWDNRGKINDNIDKILLELNDEKPTAVRQCLKALENILKYKKELTGYIKKYLSDLDYMKYNESMQGLIYKDMQNILNNF